MFNWLKKTASAAKAAPDAEASAKRGSASISELDIRESEAFKNQGNACFGAGKLEEAAEFYRQAIARNPRYAEACSNLGSVLQAQGKLQEAVVHYREAVTLNPDLLTAHNNLAFALMQLGQTDAARESFQRVVALDPEHAAALQNLGIIAAQSGDFPQAETLLRRALITDEKNPALHTNLGHVLKSQDRMSDAKAAYQRATFLDPSLAEAHYSLGNVLQSLGQLQDALDEYDIAISLRPDYTDALNNQATALNMLGRHEEAAKSCRHVLKLGENHFHTHNNLGNALHGLGRIEDSIASYRKAIDMRPDYAEAHNNMGIAFWKSGRIDDAEACYRHALQIRPNYFDAHNNLGLVCKEQGRIDDAEACYRQALLIKPDDAETHFNLGTLCQEMQRMAEAEENLRRALQIKPDHAEAHNNLGGLLKESGRMVEAEASFRRALQIRPEYADGLFNLGIVLQDMGRMDEAESYYRQALQIKPDHGGAYNNLGGIFKDIGQMEEAEACYRRALDIKQDDVFAYSNLAFTLNYNSDRSREEILAVHQNYDQRFGLPLREKWHPHNNRREPRRRLKVGYVSPDLRMHSVAFFLEPLLREHDRQSVDLYCYAEVARPDTVTIRLQRLTDHWRSTVGMSDEALARQIAEDGIDILVDLAGHSSHNRLLVFARKPAPVQVTWLGYPHSTGLLAMDYRLVDTLTDPPGDADALASEALVRLDDGFLCYAAPVDAPPPAPPPNMASGNITFGSFNNPAKLSSVTLDIWAMLLGRVPDSRLIVKGKCFVDNVSKKAFLAKLTQRGVNAERVTMLGLTTDLAAHLENYGQLDIALDPFPYNGTTTTCEALWMGVPVVTLLGDRHAGRVGASLLTQIGMTDLIANSAQSYIDIAVALAENTSRLHELRWTLRERMVASPLCTAQIFARKMETAYRDMWHHYCAKVEAGQQ
jgi:predicted O-linked N-acetylglucosamine transferase (SPINDLY family)